MKYEFETVDVLSTYSDLKNEKLILSLLKGYLGFAATMSVFIGAISGHKATVYVDGTKIVFDNVDENVEAALLEHGAELLKRVD